jgi:hypothetical protein
MNLKKYFVHIFKLIWRKLQPFGVGMPLDRAGASWVFRPVREVSRAAP